MTERNGFIRILLLCLGIVVLVIAVTSMYGYALKDTQGAPSKDKYTRVMEVQNPELQFSQSCKVLRDTAYITITSISSYDSVDLWKDLKILKTKKIKKAVVYLNSPGGSAFQGMGITDELRLVKNNIRITVEGRGIIASAAVPIFLVADRRIVSKYTIFLIHPASLLKWGVFTEKLEDLKSQAKMISMLQNNYAETVASATKLTKEQALALMAKDNWFTATEALKMGFVDEVR